MAGGDGDKSLIHLQTEFLLLFIGSGELEFMSNIIAGAIAVSMALAYLLYYAFRLKTPVLLIIILFNASALVYDYYKSIKVGEDHI